MNNCDVLTRTGMVRGKYQDGVYQWFGIPYAEKPLGKLRFRQAVPVKSWKGILDATEYQEKPVQGDFLMEVQNSQIEESEDCLYLNIMSKNRKGKKPVLVWIYGGAFIMGEPSTLMYNGIKFAKDDVVFVSINYRLGIYGGYDLSHLNGGNDLFDDNIFISDQLQALRWIHQNIAVFGGDPRNITIMGESAGGTSVINLMAVPKARGLFKKVICESGVIGATVRPEVGNVLMKLLLQHLGIPEDKLEQIKELKKEEYEEASVWLLNNYTRKYPGYFLPGPMLGSLLPEHPLDAIRKGKCRGIKLLIGTNLDEATLFVKEQDGNICSNRQEVEAFLKDIQATEEDKGRLQKLYGDYGEGKGLLDFMRDVTFTYHSALAADYQSRFDDTYLYEFTYATEMAQKINYGAFHTSEIPFVFNTRDEYEMKMLHSQTSEEILQYFTNLFHTRWVNFIKYGNPNGIGKHKFKRRNYRRRKVRAKERTYWPKYDPDNKRTLIIDQKCKIRKDPYGAMKQTIGHLNIHQ